jgi:hypothetical protein
MKETLFSVSTRYRIDENLFSVSTMCRIEEILISVSTMCRMKENWFSVSTRYKKEENWFSVSTKCNLWNRTKQDKNGEKDCYQGRSNTMSKTLQRLGCSKCHVKMRT